METKDNLCVFDKLQFILSKLIGMIPEDSETLRDIIKEWDHIKGIPKTKYCNFVPSDESIIKCYNVLWDGLLKLSRSDHNYVNVIWNSLENLDSLYEIIPPMSYIDALDTCSKAARQAILDEHRGASYNCDWFDMMRHDIKKLLDSEHTNSHVLSEIRRIVTSLDQ